MRFVSPCILLLQRAKVFHSTIRNFASLQHKQIVNITFIWSNGMRKTAPAKVGESLLDVVLNNDVDIDGFGACEGTLACSTCHLIFSKKDYDNLKDPLCPEEQDMLDIAYGVTDTSRLGCQIIVAEDMDGMVIKVPDTIFDART